MTLRYEESGMDKNDPPLGIQDARGEPAFAQLYEALRPLARQSIDQPRARTGVLDPGRRSSSGDRIEEGNRTGRGTSFLTRQDVAVRAEHKRAGVELRRVRSGGGRDISKNVLIEPVLERWECRFLTTLDDDAELL